MLGDWSATGSSDFWPPHALRNEIKNTNGTTNLLIEETFG
jgi:hypothetical protein